MVLNGYDRIAWLYDSLAQWVFRGSVLQAQCCFLSSLKPDDQVLIIGGGSGQVLTEIQKLHIPVRIDFIEPSHQMIEKARRRVQNTPSLSINFYEKEFQSFITDGKYDWVYCFFFFDLFKKETLDRHLDHVMELMKTESVLWISDFQNMKGVFWQRFLVYTMHVFFKWTTNLESRRLKDINAIVKAKGFKKTKCAKFFNQFIFSALYKKEVL